jgi:hypothetical protein
MPSVKEEIHLRWSPAETRGTHAPDTGRLPAVPVYNIRGVKEAFH